MSIICISLYMEVRCPIDTVDETRGSAYLFYSPNDEVDEGLKSRTYFSDQVFLKVRR